ncbi:hypothetical protein ABT160_08000 [Streptomyces sp. NPDC001941]|uniref:hypothetical protein n=1 Tax=Streptomyces sp. NPDC001941 TaxID=3154659 RepID=UPI003324C0B5
MPADETVISRAMFSRRPLKPIADPRPMERLPERIWSDADWERIRRGYAARDMDEKWHVITEEHVVHLHRSWTGKGIYTADFAPVEDGWRIVSAVAQRRRVPADTDDAYDRVMLELVMSSIVLGEPAADLRSALVELTRENSGSDDVAGGVVLHSSLGLRSDS